MSLVPQLPSLTSSDGLKKYMLDIKRFPLLSAEEEYQYARELIDHKSRKAAHILITSHLRLVVAISYKYKRYGLSIADIIAEGNIGLMRAVAKFDPEKGFRLATYALWWIKASIQEYILRSWSLVKIGTTAAQKKLFFNLNKAKKNINALDKEVLTPEEIEKISNFLDVSETEVEEMQNRLGGSDFSLNTPMLSDESSQTQWQDTLQDDRETQDVVIAENNEQAFQKKILHEALSTLSSREQDIITARKMTDPPIILEDLSIKHKISKERIRQIEQRAYDKLKDKIQNLLEFRKPKLL